MKHGSTQFLAADALEILNSISTTRQNKDFSPRHCDRIGAIVRTRMYTGNGLPPCLVVDELCLPRASSPYKLTESVLGPIQVTLSCTSSTLASASGLRCWRLQRARSASLL